MGTVASVMHGIPFLLTVCHFYLILKFQSLNIYVVKFPTSSVPPSLVKDTHLSVD